MKTYIENELAKKKAVNQVEPITLELYKEEKDYLEKNDSIINEQETDITLIEKDPRSRFAEAYIERCNKETEEFLSEEPSSFLDQPIDYFLKHIDEFMYLESSWFDIIGVDAISFEVDSVFKTYDVMLGLKVPKKFEASIKNYFSKTFINDVVTFDLMFNSNDGIWDVNFSLNDLAQFQPDWTIREAFCSVYNFLFRLRELIEQDKS